MARLALTLAALIPLLGACSDSQDEKDCPRAAQAGYEARAPFDSRALVRRVDCGFRGNVPSLGVAADGSTWLYRVEFKDHGEDTFYYPAVKLLTHVGPGGELLGELRLPDFATDFVVHPSGELTVFGWEKEAEKTALQLRRLGPDGSVLAQRVLRNDVPPEERLNFVATPDGQVVKTELPEEQRVVAIFASRASGEDAYVLAAMDGFRLLRLGSRLETQWVSVVEPSVALRATTNDQMRAMGAPLTGWSLDVDEAGRAHVAIPFLDAHRRAYVDTFQRTPEGPQSRGILVSSFEPSGAWRSSRVLPTALADELTGLAVGGGAFAVSAHTSIQTGQKDKPADSNLFFASGRWDRPAEEYVARDFSLDRDEAPTGLVACGAGRYCLVGHTGYVELATGRTQDNGKGFLLTLDASGAQQDLLLLEGERDTQVLRAAARPDGSVVFAFSTNEAANLGRVADHLKNNEVWLGVYGGP